MKSPKVKINEYLCILGKDVLGTWLPIFHLPTLTEDLALLSGKLQIISFKNFESF